MLISKRALALIALTLLLALELTLALVALATTAAPPPPSSATIQPVLQLQTTHHNQLPQTNLPRSLQQQQQQSPQHLQQQDGSLAKLVANVDHWINTLQNFTLTREWSSLMKVFQGTETILNLFISPFNNVTTSASTIIPSTSSRSSLVLVNTTTTTNTKDAVNKKSSTTTVAPLVSSVQRNITSTLTAKATLNSTSTIASRQQQTSHLLLNATPSSTSSSSLPPSTSKVQTVEQNVTKLVENLKLNLPNEVLTLTSSLNNLFPWHVWPWNNLDLYSTVDTFLNHGIFAFSKTTVGPERRIDYLPDMLQTLFKALKYDTFPKKCQDWSNIICHDRSFMERMMIPPNLGGEESSAAVREEKVKELLAGGGIGAKKNHQLTQELTCIMFSSLSMQHFGASKELEEAQRIVDKFASSEIGGGGSINRLSWDKQVHKALKLYSLSREALSDQQWRSLYNLINDLWSQQKISDRVIMVGRVIQLLTNCHMPKEMLESALWKDIYKYKNVLNQLVDIVIEELNRSGDTGKVTIQQISLGSKHLDEILRRFIKFLPKLIEALSKTVVDELPELVEKFFNEKVAFFKVPCKGYSFSDIIPSLSKYHKEIIEIEDLVCKQINTKPNITMSQINNLTNDFLAMAFNFSNFSSALALPKLYTDHSVETTTSSQVVTTNNSSIPQPTKEETNITSVVSGEQQQESVVAVLSKSTQDDQLSSGVTINVTSIVDELAANPRLAQIVAILQSSALDPPEVHAELPELDWVEAGTSIALFYESIQRLLSYEEPFVIFPEIENFQEEMKKHTDTSQVMFRKFSKRDPIRLVAYSLDIVMPIALRTFKPMESFQSECQSTFRDIFSEELDGKPIRQWQCTISSMNFASWAINSFMKTFNSMFRLILDQMSFERAWTNRQTERLLHQKPNTNNEKSVTSLTNTTKTCIIFDGSVSMMLDNLPQFIDLGLETVLMASTTSDQHLTLYDVMCSTDYILDPFNEQSVELKAQMKDKMCHLFHKRSLTNCANVLRVEQWKTMMKELNSTWFETNAISIKPSFREITINIHEFLGLFGQFKPSTTSDSLIARVLNVNSFWRNLLNRTMSIIDKYQEKRFEYALQTLTPIIYDNLPTTTTNLITESSITVVELDPSNDQSSSLSTSSKPLDNDSNIKEVRELLITTILGARAILNYLEKQSAIDNNNQQSASTNGTVPNVVPSIITSKTNSTDSASDINENNRFELQINSLFNWADQYSMIYTETFLRTLANNITKLESIFKPPNEESNNNSSSNSNQLNNRFTISDVWQNFCNSPVDKYLDLSQYQLKDDTSNQTEPGSTTNLTSSYATSSLEETEVFKQMTEGKEAICNFKWQTLYNQLGADSNKVLAEYPERQLTRIALTKWGQVLDVMLIESKQIKQLPKFFYMDYWQQFRDKLPQITPLKDQPSNLNWIWQGFESLIRQLDEGLKQQVSHSLVRILDQLNCGLDAVKGGLSWENIANIYSDKQDILAVHSTINNGFTLASIGVNTFLAHKKFQKFLDEFVKPRAGLSAFCEQRDRSQLENIFSIPRGQDSLTALESFQELICDTNFETLALNINPISICYQTQSSAPTIGNNATTIITTTPSINEHPLAENIDRFFKLASLAILDAKLVASTDSKPALLSKNLWFNFWNWWSGETGPQPTSGVALTTVRTFQTLDSINSNHVVWKALFKAVNEVSEVVAYLLRAVEKKHRDSDMIGAATRLSLVKEAASKLDTAIKSLDGKSSSTSSLIQQQQLASILSNIMFPEVNNFISFRTFKQLRYIKSITDYFTQTQGAQESICKNSTYLQSVNKSDEEILKKQIAKLELIGGYKINTNERLFSLLCHYPPKQWLTVLNIVISTRTTAIPKKVNHMTKYLSIFTRAYKENEKLDNFVHGQQLENIENVANTTVSYLVATSYSLKSLSFSKLSNISWHSLPNLLDSIDRHLCSSRFDAGTFHIPAYEPKKMELETLLCKLPQWNITQVYNYLNENFDLQNMISLITEQTNNYQQQQQHQQPLEQSQQNSTTIANNKNSTLTSEGSTNKLAGATVINFKSRPCITPFKFASRWLKIVQETVDEWVSKSSRDKIRKCLSLSRKGQSVSTETLRLVKYVNTILSSIDDLTTNDSWHLVKRTWNSISYLLLSQNPAYISKLY